MKLVPWRQMRNEIQAALKDTHMVTASMKEQAGGDGRATNGHEESERPAAPAHSAG